MQIATERTKKTEEFFFELLTMKENTEKKKDMWSERKQQKRKTVIDLSDEICANYSLTTALFIVIC